MNGIIAGLTFLAIALGIQRAFLLKRETALRVKEQAFRFHALRDNLQLFSLDGKIQQASPSYGFLLALTNLGIKNAGILNVRDILLATKGTIQEVDTTRINRLLDDIRQQGKAFQELAANCFLAFGDMLICNDPIVRWGIRCYRFAKPCVGWIAKIMPERSSAAHYSQRFRKLGHTLEPA